MPNLISGYTGLVLQSCAPSPYAGQHMSTGTLFTAALLSMAAGVSGLAKAYPPPQEGDWITQNFTFHTGETLPELRQHYLTIGSATGQPALILHGTLGNGRAMLTPTFADQLFGPGQPLDAQTHFIILPDTIGAGGSSKPSNGLRAKFPEYNYRDMVRAQYLLLTEGLRVRHLRLLLGCSMGGMLTWLWGEMYPDYMDALVPLAAQPFTMAGRNWMVRRMAAEMVAQDPAYENGNYSVQPASVRLASVFLDVATNGGTLGYQAQAPTRELADQLVDKKLAQPSSVPDANDFIYIWRSSRDYSAEGKGDLERISAWVLMILSEDDERNPPGTDLENVLKRVPQAELFVIPASTQTCGHSTFTLASLWKDRLLEFMKTVPFRSK